MTITFLSAELPLFLFMLIPWGLHSGLNWWVGYRADGYRDSEEVPPSIRCLLFPSPAPLGILGPLLIGAFLTAASFWFQHRLAEQPDYYDGVNAAGWLFLIWDVAIVVSTRRRLNAQTHIGS